MPRRCLLTLTSIIVEAGRAGRTVRTETAPVVPETAAESQGIMNRTLKLGTAFGIGLYVHWTFLLLIPYTAIMIWDRGQAWAANLAVLGLAFPLVVCIFGCVLLHELGHALAARFCGISTRDITLYPIGGVARLERMSERPAEEILIAVAGPLVNVFLAGVLFGALIVLTGVRPLLEGGSVAGSLIDLVLMGLVVLFWGNVMLVAFNMLPCFPMDGGRVLRALLALGLGHLRATEVAAGLGIFVAFCLGVLPIFQQVFNLPIPASPMLIVVAGFVVFAGQQELAVVRHRAAARKLAQEVTPAVPVSPEVVLLPEAPSGGFSGFTWDERSRLWVVWRDGKVVHTFAAPPE